MCLADNSTAAAYILNDQSVPTEKVAVVCGIDQGTHGQISISAGIEGDDHGNVLGGIIQLRSAAFGGNSFSRGCGRTSCGGGCGGGGSCGLTACTQDKKHTQGQDEWKHSFHFVGSS